MNTKRIFSKVDSIDNKVVEEKMNYCRKET